MHELQNEHMNKLEKKRGEPLFPKIKPTRAENIAWT